MIVLFATGEGITSPFGTDGKIIAADVRQLLKPVSPVTVTIGGFPAEVQYAGSAPGSVSGALQVNVCPGRRAVGRCRSRGPHGGAIDSPAHHGDPVGYRWSLAGVPLPYSRGSACGDRANLDIASHAVAGIVVQLRANAAP